MDEKTARMDAYVALKAWRDNYREGMIRGAMAVGRERGYSDRDFLDLTDHMKPDEAVRAHGFRQINLVEDQLWRAVAAIFMAMDDLVQVAHSLPPRESLSPLQPVTFSPIHTDDEPSHSQS